MPGYPGAPGFIRSTAPRRISIFFPKPPTSEAGFETKFSKVRHQRVVFTLQNLMIEPYQINRIDQNDRTNLNNRINQNYQSNQNYQINQIDRINQIDLIYQINQIY